MDFVKFIMGSAMIALAIFYVQPVVGEQVFLGLVGLALILISGFFGAFDKEDTPLLQMKKGCVACCLCCWTAVSDTSCVSWAV
jgi:thiol:disulfide interchange protein